MINILPTVSKPTRYIGNELNVIRKDLASARPLLRFALAFPDIYDVGMSHLGLKILYSLLNSRDDVWAERVYAPWVDMEEKMRREHIQLFSLESSSPLRNFDIIGFSLQYEMSYTNILNMLELAHIPLLAKDRDKNYPLIIAGGPCAFNPEPLADFIDFFVIGDGEEVVAEIVDCYKSHRHKEKYQLLSKMADIEGVYVPSLVSLKEQPDGTLVVSDSAKIRKRVVSDLDSASYPTDYIVPFMRPIHDRAIIEIMRGCSRGCRFCQAGMIYRPVRERSSSSIKELADEIIRKTGYEELSLSSLSSCDHSSIHEIIQHLVESLGKKKHVSISLPSLRTDAFSIELAQKLACVGKTGLTFAPEVATDRLQKFINKDIPRSQVLSVSESAFSSGWDSLKLYFMIGLPTETEDDVAEIASLVKEVLYVARRANRRANLNVSVSTFVPKAHTPFQWERQLSINETQQRQKLLMDKIGRNDRVDLSFHSPKLSYLEGVFARGDRRLCRVLHEAHLLGCKLDGWSEFFNFDAWMEAFARCEIDPDIYHKARNHDQVMPWDHIDTYITKDFLLTERNKAYMSQVTPDCRVGKCAKCGICDEKIKVKLDTREKEQEAKSERVPAVALNPAPVQRIRAQFAKREEVKFISHLDLINVFTRAFRRAEIPIAYSHGFNPHPKISFGSALAVGITSTAEFVDIDLETYMEPEDFVFRSNSQMPSGLEFLKACEIPLRTPSLMAQTCFASYIVRIAGSDRQAIGDPDTKIRSIMSMNQIIIDRSQRMKYGNKHRSNGSNLVDIKPYIRSIRLLGYTNKTLEIEMVLGDSGSSKVRPEEVVYLILEAEKHKFSALDIQKIGFFTEYQGRLFSPMEVIT